MPFTPYRWPLLLSFVLNVQWILPLSRLSALDRNDQNVLGYANLRANPGGVSYSFLSAPTRPSSSDRNATHDPCSIFGEWKSAEKTWTDYLTPSSWLLCHKNYGSDGNCFYHTVSGLLKDIMMKREELKFSERLPPGILMSAKKLQYDGTYFTHQDLRRLAAIYFIGVNPYDEDAVSHFDKKAFEEKLEFTTIMQETENYSDIQWNPGTRLGELKSGQDGLEVAKRVYSDLSSSSPVKTWAAHHDIVALSHIFNLAFFIIHSNSRKVQFIKHDASEPSYTFLLYYFNMLHFAGAGLCKAHENELYVRFINNSIPDIFSNLLHAQNNS